MAQHNPYCINHLAQQPWVKILFNVISYRICRLRRLIATCLAILILGFLSGYLLFGPVHLFDTPFIKTSTAVACVAVIFALVLIYPAVWWDTICAALTLGLFLMLLPLLERLPMMGSAQPTQMTMVWIVFGIAVAGIFIWLGLYMLLPLLVRIPAKNGQMSSQFSVSMDPDHAFELLKIKPDFDDGFHNSGSVQCDGFFPLSHKVNTFDPATFLPTRKVIPLKVRIEEESSNHQVATLLSEVDGEGHVDVWLLEVSRKRGRTICKTTTRMGAPGWYMNIGFWLQDFGSDHEYSRFLTAQGRTSYCIRDYAYRGLFTDIARLCNGTNSDIDGPKPGF